MTIISRRLMTAALAISAGAAWLGAAGPAAAQQSWAEVEAAAKKEAKLTLYHNIRPAGIEEILKKFRAKYPEIQTEQIRLGSGPLNERFRTEFAANRHIADVVITYADSDFMKEVPNWFAKWQPPELKGNFPASVNTSDQLYAIMQVREAIIWNKNLVKDADAPKEWADLMDPKWKGKVALNTPWRSISVQQMFAYWEKIGIKDAAEKFKANDVRFFEGSSGIIQAVVRGDAAVAHITDIPLNGMLADGAPIGFTYPKSGTTTSDSIAGVAAKAPHPNVGRVFVNWLMTKEGQALLVDQGGLSATRNDAPALSHVPATAKLSNVVDGMTVLTPEIQKPLIEHWRKVFGVK
ncbi:MAG: ABC transporter substrate-binding protein [Hyphomicrobiaceae bacterium]